MFVHLHVHSAYSGLGGVAGASSLEALAAAAVERGMTTLALTDTNGVWGAMDFRRVADAYGLTPIYGVSLETARERAVLLPRDAQGWASLCRVVTAFHNDKDFVLSSRLSVDRDGLVILTPDSWLADVVAHAPTHCGRGSVANSIVSYCLGLTHVDPLQQGLVFERFLNPGRKDPPDADLDFPWAERDAALEYVFRKYGPA